MTSSSIKNKLLQAWSDRLGFLLRCGVEQVAYLRSMYLFWLAARKRRSRRSTSVAPPQQRAAPARESRRSLSASLSRQWTQHWQLQIPSWQRQCAKKIVYRFFPSALTAVDGLFFQGFEWWIACTHTPIAYARRERPHVCENKLKILGAPDTLQVVRITMCDGGAKF